MPTRYPTFQLASTAIAVGGAAANPVPWPAHEAGDLGFLIVESLATTISLSTPNGFTLFSMQQTAGTGNAATTLAVFKARATSSSMASPIIAATADHTHAAIVTFRNTEDPPTTTINVVKKETTNTTTILFPSFTTTTPNVLIVGFAAVSTDTTTANLVSAVSTNGGVLSIVSERFDGGNNAGQGGGVFCFTAQKASIGATGTISATMTGQAADLAVMATIGLQARVAGYRVFYSGGTGTLPAVDTAVNYDVSASADDASTGVIASIFNGSTSSSGSILVVPTTLNEVAYGAPGTHQNSSVSTASGWTGIVASVTYIGAVASSASTTADTSSSGSFTVASSEWVGYWGIYGINPGISP